MTLLGEPQNLVSYHLRLLRDGGLVTTMRSSFDGRDSYYHLDLDRCEAALADVGTTLHPSLRRESLPQTPPVDLRRSPRVLRHRTSGQVDVVSAGSRPRPHLLPAHRD